jgi:hypothetical protein
MTLLEPTLLSIGRAATVALTALLVLLGAGPSVRSAPRRLRTLVFWLAMAAMLAPGFVLGFVTSQKPTPFGTLDYLTLLFMRYSALALLVVWLVPGSVSQEALHCFRQSGSRSRWQLARWELRAWGRGLWLGVALVFFVAFQEFELATTWNLRAWTVALFDAQAGGLPLGDSLSLALPPLVSQLVLLAVLLVNARAAVPPVPESTTPMSRRAFSAFALAFGALGWGFLALLPVIFLPDILFHNRLQIILDIVPWREIANGIGLAVAGTALGWGLAHWVGAGRSWRWLIAILGLLGPLLCSLLLAAAMRWGPLFWFRDTVFAPVIGLALVLLPFALLLHFGIENARDRTAWHAAHLAKARWPLWWLDGWPRLIALLLLFCFAYGDFTVNSILAPPQFTSASVRLLNLLHYGKSPALLVMFFFAFAIPFGFAWLTALIAHFYARQRVR